MEVSTFTPNVQCTSVHVDNLYEHILHHDVVQHRERKWDGERKELRAKKKREREGERRGSREKKDVQRERGREERKTLTNYPLVTRTRPSCYRCSCLSCVHFSTSDSVCTREHFADQL